MSVVGIDFGTRSCVIAVAQKGGVDVITNDVSNRQTPNMVSFGEKERYIGEAGSTQWLRNVKHTVTDIKRVLGRSTHEQDLQEEKKRLAYNIQEEGGRAIVEVMYRNEMARFTPEAIAGMILNKLRLITEAWLNTKVKDVVISVPGYWTDSQRRALLDASRIAGLNCLRLMNEITASALSYGIYKTDLSETDPIKVLFVDVGETSTSVAVVAFQKGQLKVLGTAYDANLGGRNFDDVLLTHFANEFKEKYKIDIYTNQKALIRVRVACEKLKKVLSANSDAPINIDSLMNDIDVKGMMNRKTFEELSTGLLDKVCEPVRLALEESGVSKDQLFSVEVTGGGSRLLSLQKKLNAFFGKDPSRTLNSEESVARGCALQCAMLSPVFKVREFAVNDVSLYPIRLSWKCVGDAAVTEDSAEVFTRNNPIPSPKMITFNRGNEIKLVAQYATHPTLPADVNTLLGEFSISNIPAPSTQDASAKVRVKVKLDLNGIFYLENAQLVESVDQPQTDAPQPMETEAAPTSPAPASDATPTSPPAAAAAAKTEEEPKKRKVKRSDVPFTCAVGGIQTNELAKLIDEERRMSADDLVAIETADAKNAVETYVYNIRSRINDDLSDYTTEQEKTALTKLTEETESWLYGDGEDVAKGLYQKKLDEMKKLGDPIVVRKREAEERPDALKSLIDAISHWQHEASTLDDKYSHIDKADKDRILADVESARTWLLTQRGKQDELKKTDNPTLLSSDLVARKNNLEKMARPLLSKPKPKPKPEPAPAKPAEAKPAPTPAPNPDQPSTPQQEGGGGGGESADAQTPASPSQAEPQEPPKAESSMDID